MSKLLLVLVVGLVAGLGAVNGEITIGGPEDFLNQRQTNKQNTDDVRQALLALNIPDGVELTADVIEEAFVKAGQDEKIRFALLDLGSYGYCRDYTIDSLIAIFREEELEQFKSFFEKHWFEKIQQCAEVARRDMINDYETNEFVYSLEDFIKTAVPVERGVSDEDYYEILKGVDLNNLERYNTPAVKAIVSNDRTSNRNRRGKNVSAGDVNKYIKFVTKKCSHFINLQDEFIISNLAQRYENAPEVPDQLTLDIYGELNRICMSWLNGGDKERKELMKNSIKEQQEAAYFIPISRRR